MTNAEVKKIDFEELDDEDMILTQDDLESVRQAVKEHKEGKTVRLV